MKIYSNDTNILIIGDDLEIKAIEKSMARKSKKEIRNERYFNIKKNFSYERFFGNSPKFRIGEIYGILIDRTTEYWVILNASNLLRELDLI